MAFFRDVERVWRQGRDAQPKQPRSRRGLRRGWLIILGTLVALLIFLVIGKGIYTEWLWFDSLGFSSVYTTIIGSRVWLFFAGAFGFFALLGSNLFLARRLSPITRNNILIGEGLVVVRRVLDMGILATTIFLSIIFGLVTSGNWEVVLRFANAVNSGATSTGMSLPPILLRPKASWVILIFRSI